jgi:hypothetical protein
MIAPGKIRFTKPIVSGAFTFNAGTLAMYDGSAQAKVMLNATTTYTVTLTTQQKTYSIEAAP